MKPAFIALGSNLNNPLQQVKQALIELQSLAIRHHSKILRLSSFYQTKPLGPSNQADFINTVVEFHTEIPPAQLLKSLHAIEDKQGRVRQEKWGPRTIDLDIILYANEMMQSENLQLPHPGVYTREFWIYPLYEIAPQLILPTGESLVELKNKCADNGLKIIAEK